MKKAENSKRNAHLQKYIAVENKDFVQSIVPLFSSGENFLHGTILFVICRARVNTEYVFRFREVLHSDFKIICF